MPRAPLHQFPRYASTQASAPRVQIAKSKLVSFFAVGRRNHRRRREFTTLPKTRISKLTPPPTVRQCRRSLFVPQCHHRIDTHCPPRREPRRKKRRRQQHHNGQPEKRRIVS